MSSEAAVAVTILYTGVCNEITIRTEGIPVLCVYSFQLT